MTTTPKIEKAIEKFTMNWLNEDKRALRRLIRMAQREAVKQATKRADNRPEGYAE